MPAPAFDPNQPFEKIGKPAAPAFDPNQPFEKAAVDNTQHDTSDRLNASLSGAGQAMTMGYLPQLQAGALSAAGDPTKESDDALRKQGFKIQQTPWDYTNLRDDAINTINKQKEEMPGDYYTGVGVGTAVMAPIMGAGLSKIPGLAASKSVYDPFIKAATGTAGFGTKLAQATAGGGLMGAVQNPGDTPGQVDYMQLGDRAKNAAIGGLVGGGVQLGTSAVQGIGNAVSSVPSALTNYAEKLSEAVDNGDSKSKIKDILHSMLTGAKYGATGGFIKGGPEEAIKLGLLGAGGGALKKAGELYGKPLLASGAQSAGTALAPLAGVGNATSNLLTPVTQNPALTGAMSQGLLKRWKK